jgi:hypothetical protein
MRLSNCPLEAEALKAVRTEMWEDALTAHVAGCAACKEIVRASHWMQALANGSQKAHSLPDPSLLWWRARLSAKQAQVERAQEMLEWVEIVAATVIVAGLAGWIGWNWLAIQSTLTSLLTEPWPQLWIDAATAMSTTPTMFSISAAILCVIAIALGYPLLLRD